MPDDDTTRTYSLIQDMPPDERPRERLERYGASRLTTPELLAIMLRVGIRGASALQLGSQLLNRYQTLRALFDASISDLSKIKGIGSAKACQLKAAFELGKRLATNPNMSKPTIGTPLDAVNLVMEDMRYQREERFRVMFLDTRHQMLAMDEINIGTLNASIVHPRDTFRAAIERNAAAIILLHNHPSGDPTPSKEDLELTGRLVEAGKLLGIPVLDHLVIGDGRFISLKEQGMC